MVKSTIIFEPLYAVSILTIKISILCLYRRIFPQRWLKYALLATGVLTAAHCICFFCLSIFQCLPLRSLVNPNIRDHCVNFATAGLILGIANVLTDIMALTLPVPIIWRLQTSKTRKRLTTMTFLLGGL